MLNEKAPKRGKEAKDTGDQMIDVMTPFLGSREGFLLKVGKVRKVCFRVGRSRDPWLARPSSGRLSFRIVPHTHQMSDPTSFSPFLQSIRERWFVMCRMKLAYYKTRDSDRPPIRVLDLLKCSQVECLENQQRPNCFVCVCGRKEAVSEETLCHDRTKA
jgi:hypothetical protein